MGNAIAQRAPVEHIDRWLRTHEKLNRKKHMLSVYQLPRWRDMTTRMRTLAARRIELFRVRCFVLRTRQGPQSPYVENSLGMVHSAKSRWSDALDPTSLVTPGRLHDKTQSSHETPNCGAMMPTELPELAYGRLLTTQNKCHTIRISLFAKLIPGK